MNSKEKWVFQTSRWAAYKQGVQDRYYARVPKDKELMGKFYKSYLEGYAETRQSKISKYGPKTK